MASPKLISLKQEFPNMFCYVRFLCSKVEEMRDLEGTTRRYVDDAQFPLRYLRSPEEQLAPVVRFQALERLVNDNLAQEFGSHPLSAKVEIREYAKTYDLSVTLTIKGEANYRVILDEYKERLRTAVGEHGRIHFDNMRHNISGITSDITSEEVLKQLAKTTDELLAKYSAKP